MRRRRPAVPAALLVAGVAVFTMVGPVFACGGLIGPNGAVNLLRTTTFVGYHDGVEHYVTAFAFAGGGGSSARSPRFRACPRASSAAATGPSSGWSARPSHRSRKPSSSGRPLRRPPARRSSCRRGSTRSISRCSRAVATTSGRGPRRTASGCRPTRPRCWTSTPRAARSSWLPASMPMRRPRVARPSATAPRSTSRSRPRTRGSRCASSAWARPPASGSRRMSTS